MLTYYVLNIRAILGKPNTVNFIKNEIFTIGMMFILPLAIVACILIALVMFFTEKK